MTLRLSSAGESHGPALVAILSGLPAGPRARPRRGRRRSEAPPGGLRPLAAAADRAGPRRGARRPAPRPHARHAARARRAERRPQELDVGDGAVAARRRAVGQGDEAGDAAAARPCRSGGRAEVRAHRRAQLARARLGAAHRGARRSRCGREGAARRRSASPSPGSTVDEQGLRRAHRRGARRARHGRRPRRGACDRRAAGPRLLRVEGGSPRREAGGGRDGHPGGQGRRDRRRVRACGAARVRGARRDRHRSRAGRRIAPAGSRAASRTARRSSCAPR